MDSKGGRRGMNWKIGIDIYIYIYTHTVDITYKIDK